jgi:hypothetical protein
VFQLLRPLSAVRHEISRAASLEFPNSVASVQRNGTIFIECDSLRRDSMIHQMNVYLRVMRISTARRNLRKPQGAESRDEARAHRRRVNERLRSVPS